MKLKRGLVYLLAIAAVAGWRYFKNSDTDTHADTARPGTSISVNESAESIDAKGLLDVKLPAGTPSQIKHYTGFSLSFNSRNHTPNYVAWELLPHETEGSQPRYNKFWTDSDIDGCPETSDYTRSGYDRGHMCPAADQKWSEQAMVDCFALSNITPQDHALNSGAWSTLEKKERLWARSSDGLVIVAGPIYTESDKATIGASRVRVPSAFFKALLAPRANPPRAIAFVYPNMHSPGNMANYAMSIDQLEQLTSFDLFAALPDSIEQNVESTYNFNQWK